MLRGLVFAGAMVVLRLVQGAMINAWQTQSGLISIVLLLLFVIGVAFWGVRDGRADATANPDPDRRADLAMTWLLAGLVAGILSGLVSWLIALFYTAIYTGGLLNEVTTFAAFTALIVFLPGIIGVALGRWRVDRNGPRSPSVKPTNAVPTPTCSPPFVAMTPRPARSRPRRRPSSARPWLWPIVAPSVRRRPKRSPPAAARRPPNRSTCPPGPGARRAARTRPR